MQDVTYIDSDCTPGELNPEAKDPSLAAWLWEWSISASGLRPEEAEEALPGP